MLSVLTQFLSNRSQYVVVDGCRSKLVNVVSGVPQGSVLAPQLFLLYTTELFGVLLLPVWEYCSVVWCSAADSHRKLLDTVVWSAGFLSGGVLDCNLAHRRSVAELCMLFKIKRNPMHPLSGALPLPYVPACVTVVLWLLIGTLSCLLVVGLLSIAEPLCSFRCLSGTILVTLCLMVWDWRVS